MLCAALLALLALALAQENDEARRRELRADSYTRCLRGCDLASQTATWPDKATFDHCFETRCRRLRPTPEEEAVKDEM